MPIANTTVSQTFPRLQSPLIVGYTPVSLTLSTAGGPQTLTAAQLAGGFLIVDTQDVQTLTLPTAAAIQAVLGQLSIGQAFQLIVRNIGDSILTLAVNTGITSAAGNTLTTAAISTRTFLLRCTGVGSESDPAALATFTLYSMGVTLQ